MKRLPDDTGETLIELLITIVIMAIGLTSVLAALWAVVVGSDAHHSMSQGEVVTRDFGEAIKTKAIQTATYKSCPSATDLDPSGSGGFTATTTSSNPRVGPQDAVAPSLAGEGWKAQITNVEYWLSEPAPNGTFVSDADPATPGDQTPCDLDAYDTCVTALNGGYLPACDPGLQRVTYRVWNSRTGATQWDATARVLTRRNNATAP